MRSAQFFEICRGFKVKPHFDIEGDYVTIKAVKLDCIEQADFTQLIQKTEPNVIKATLSAWHGFYSWLIGKYIPLNDIYYNFPAQDHDGKNRPSNGAAYHYDHTICAQRFHKKYLDYPVVQIEGNIEDFMRKAPYYVLIKRVQQEDLTPLVKALLVKSIGTESPTAADVAQSFNISVTTLHRHLAVEGSNFQRLKNELRMEAAIHYLNCPDISTTTISDLLGFENPSTFYRSFKKWTGLPPGKYRKQLLKKGQTTP